jgi:hypothetical protein
MQSFETSATVDQGHVQIAGVPFATGTEVKVTISPMAGVQSEQADDNGAALAAARARMQELFRTIKGFRNSPKLSREELYDRHGLR